MEGWQIASIMLASPIMGWSIGILASYLILRFIKKQSVVSVGGLILPFRTMSKTQQLPVLPAENSSSDNFIGRVQIQITGSVDYRRILKLQSMLRDIPELLYVSVGGSADEENAVTVFTVNPLPLVSILGQMPIIKDVTKGENNIQVVLEEEQTI